MQVSFLSKRHLLSLVICPKVLYSTLESSESEKDIVTVFGHNLWELNIRSIQNTKLVCLGNW